MNKLLSLKVNRGLLNKYYLPRLNEKSSIVPNFGRIKGLSNPNRKREFTRTEKDIIGLGRDFIEGLRLGFRMGPNKRRRF